MDWLQIDPDLITIAAQASPKNKKRQEPFQDWVKALSDQEKTDILLEIVTGESAIASQLQARLRQQFAQAPAQLSTSNPRRSYADLKALAHRERLARKAREQEAAQKKRREYLESLQPKQGEIWQTIEYLISRKQAQSYDQAITHLIDLRDLATLEGNSAAFQSRILQLQTTYSNRPGLLRRIDEANLLNS